jgi:hypothetical protein
MSASTFEVRSVACGAHCDVGGVQFRGKCRVSNMNKEAVLVIARYGFAQLLNRPFCSWVPRRVAMKDSAGAGLHHDENVKNIESRSDRDHEVACQKGLGMVADECIPTM